MRGHSAGSHPGGVVNPFALEALRNAGVQLLQLPVETMDDAALQRELLRIAQS